MIVNMSCYSARPNLIYTVVQAPVQSFATKLLASVIRLVHELLSPQW